MINFFHKLFNPHCIHCKEEYDESKVCKSCEILQHQLEITNYEKQQLLNSLLAKPVEPTTNETENQPIKTGRYIPWVIKKQSLESEDREKARALKNASQPDMKEINELEKELNIVEKERENESAT